MREFFDVLINGEESGQKFTVKEMVVYGMLVPLGLILLMGLAGWLETNFG
jgi:hypothetical protein